MNLEKANILSYNIFRWIKMNTCAYFLSSLPFIDNCWALVEQSAETGEKSEQCGSIESATFLSLF